MSLNPYFGSLVRSVMSLKDPTDTYFQIPVLKEMV